MPRPRKSSTCVTLVLIGAAALSGCGDSASNRRAQYATREACLADWGDPKECEEQAAPRSGTSSGSHFYWGPSSSSPSRSGRSSSSSSSSSSGHSISRGGFGSHGSSAS